MDFAQNLDFFRQNVIIWINFEEKQGPTSIWEKNPSTAALNDGEYVL